MLDKLTFNNNRSWVIVRAKFIPNLDKVGSFAQAYFQGLPLWILSEISPIGNNFLGMDLRELVGVACLICECNWAEVGMVL